jgi:hypothetical protein
MRTERGAMLIHVALSLIAVLAFGALAIDYGVMWSARRQAQNAADAAALAGANSLATYGSDWDRARAVAQAIGQANYVFGQAPSITRGSGKTTSPADDISFPTCPAGAPGAGVGTCIRVNVYRNEARNPLPTFMARLFGRNVQGVKAMAIAEAAAGNATDCLRPFSLPDLWLNNDGDEQYSAGDVYRAPSDANPTGYNLATHYGMELLLQSSPHGLPVLAPGWALLVDITGGGGGTAELNNVIRGCVGSIYGVGDVLDVKNGQSEGFKHGVADLIDLDPEAYWDPVSKTIKDSCVETHTCYRYVDGSTLVADPNATVSPRVVPLPVFDPQVQFETGDVKMVNILGFFLKPMVGKDLSGILVNRPGLLVSGSGSVSPSAAFTKVTLLVR